MATMTTRQLGFFAVAPVLLLLGAPSWALAHPGHEGGLAGGLLHPLLGLDHLLAMLAVGVLAARSEGRGIWLIPAAFLGAMLVGSLAAAAGLPLPGVEAGIVASVVVLGLLIVARPAAVRGWGTAAVSLFAFFHGHAHAAEMAAGSSLVPYAAGFLLSTALLHLAGALAAIALKHAWRTQALQVVGAAIVACGALLLAGIL